MKTINLNLVQNRVDNAFGNKQTEFAIIVDSSDKMVYVVDGDETDDWIKGGYGFIQIAKVIVTHPAIMFGDYDEIRSDMVCEIEKAIVEAELCVENAAGTLFIK